MRYEGWNSVFSNDEINTNPLPVNDRSYISSLKSEFRGALCVAEKWLKHEINHSLPSIVMLRIYPVPCTVSALLHWWSATGIFPVCLLKFSVILEKHHFYMSYKTAHLTKCFLPSYAISLFLCFEEIFAVDEFGSGEYWCNWKQEIYWL
jgi:hypothetical protein